MTICNLITWVASLSAIELFKDGHSYALKPILILLSSIIIFQLFFLTLGMVISVLVKRVRNVLSYSLGLSFGMYILNTVRAIVGGEILGVFTPFYHLEPNYILEHSHFDFPIALIPIGVIIGSTIVTYRLYTKRDIDSL